MSTNSLIFTALICFALVLLIIAIRVFNRGRINLDDNEPVGYTNEQIYVGNLPYFINEEDLRGYFSRFGAIHSIKIVRNFRTGRSKGYAFVTYDSYKQANEALVAHGQDLHGRSMVVRIAKPRQEPAY